MEENTETVKEPQYLIQDLCDQIKQLTKKKLNKIQSEINKSTNLSTGVIRKYEGEISKNKPELFLIGCVEVAEKNNLSSDIINQFIAKYIQSFKNNKQYTIDLKAVFKDNNELQYERKEDEENKHIICPQVLKDKLDTFLQRSPKRFLYLAGTYNSGITISVIKYFEEKNNGESPRIFNFYEHSIKEIKNSMALKAALIQGQCVIIHVGLQTFPFSQMEFVGKGKVILLAHTPCENLYLEDMEYVVFNDLINQTKCIEELFRKYVPGILKESSLSEREIKEIFIPKMKEKTGGLPLAVYKLGTAIFEKDLLKYEENLEKYFSSPLYLNPDLQPVYEDLWKSLVDVMWKEIDSEAQSLIICASYFSGDISIDMLKFLLRDEMSEEAWKKSLSQAYRYMLIMESGRNRKEGEDGNFRGVRIFSVIKELIQFKCWKESEYSKYMKRSVEFYIRRIKNLDINAVYSGEKTFLDRGGELVIVREVLKYCSKNNLHEQYFQIAGTNMADFFYMRTKKTEIADQINAERCEIARKVKNHIQVLETYGMYMRRAVKWNKKDKALRALKLADDYYKGHSGDINIYACTRFLNGKAMTLFKVQRDMNASRIIWKDMLEKCELTDREQSWCVRWSLKCDFCTKNKPLDEIVEEAQENFKDARAKGFYRAAVDYLLYIAKCCFLMYLQDPMDNGYVDQMERFLNDAAVFLEKYSFLDNQYRAEYLYFYCCVLTIRGKETTDDILQQTLKTATDVNEIHKYKILKQLLNKLSEMKKNGDFEYENGAFYDKIVCFC